MPRIEKAVEQKGMVPESQAGFRSGRATIDNSFVLNHLMQRERKKWWQRWKSIYVVRRHEGGF